MLGPQEAAEVGGVQPHHHGDVIQTAQREEGVEQHILLHPLLLHLGVETEARERVFKQDLSKL